MRYEIREKDGINIKPENEVEEIMQNVRMIIGTVKGTCVMYREFGIENVQDIPENIAIARLNASIAEEISKYEPRAKLQRIEYSRDERGLRPKVVIEIG